MKQLDQYQNQAGSLSGKLTEKEKMDLIQKFVPLVKIMAYRMAARLPTMHLVDDLISCGNIGLLEAIESYNPRLMIKFETFAKFRIRGAMLDEMRQRDWLPRSVRAKLKEIEQVQRKLASELSRMPDDVEMANALGLSLEEYHQLIVNTQPAGMISYDDVVGDSADAKHILDFLEDKTTVHPDLEVQFKELKSRIIDALEQLQQDEQMIMALYYYEGLTLKEISEVMKLTESRISQIHAKALHKLNWKLDRYRKDLEDLEILQKSSD